LVYKDLDLEFKQYIRVHKSMEARYIISCTLSITKNNYVYGNEVFHFDNRLVDIADSRYRGALGAFICPLQLLSEFLLTLDDDDLMLKVQRKTSSTGKNYISVY
jgi:hypothetical protein